MGFGKWIAGALGWAILGPIGGILGYYFASRVEKLSKESERYTDANVSIQEQRNSFLMSLLGWVSPFIFPIHVETSFAA